MKINIRQAHPRDAEQIASLLRSMEWFSGLREETFSETKTRIAKNIEILIQDNTHSTYIAEDPNGQLLGIVSVHWLPYLILSGLEGYISELFVAEEARNQGIGTLLLSIIKAEARERGCFRLALINNKERESYQRQFYTKQGWRERPQMVNFIYRLN
jgi:GNAT superfamily N-acetyltransferase